MKKIHILLLLAVCGLVTACMDGDWDEPTISQAPFGNNAITDDGVVTIAQLKADPDFKAFIKYSKCVKVEKNVKIRGRVTGNDLGGNLYKQFALQDETGAIIIAVNQNGLNGYLAEGQEILVDLQGMYIGAYGGMPEIGTPYNGGIGRMSKDVWQEHFKILGGTNNIQPQAIQPAEFTKEFAANIDENCGKLVTLKGVHFAAADGTKTLIDGTASGGNYFNQRLKESFGATVVVRTSSYADFAAMVMPTDAVDLTGIATRFGDDWQIMLRKTSDLVIEK